MPGTVSGYLENGLEKTYNSEFPGNIEHFNDLLHRDETATPEHYATTVSQLAELGAVCKWDFDRSKYVKSASIAFTCYLEKLALESTPGQTLVEMTKKLFGLFKLVDFKYIDQFLSEIFKLKCHRPCQSLLLDTWLTDCLKPFLNTQVVTPYSPLVTSDNEHTLADCFNTSQALVSWLVNNIEQLELMAQRRSVCDTPVIHLCAAWGMSDVLAKLLAAGADIELTDNTDDESLPLHYLALPHVLTYVDVRKIEIRQFMEAVELLMPRNGIDADDRNGRTLFSLLIEFSSSINPGILVELVRLGANKNWSDSEGKMPLHYLGKNDFSVGVINYLMSIYSRDDWLLEDHDRNTPMHCIAQTGNLDLIRVLVNECGVPVATNSLGTWPSDMLPDDVSDELRQLLTAYEQSPVPNTASQTDTATLLATLGTFRDDVEARLGRIETAVDNLGHRVDLLEAQMVSLQPGHMGQ